MMTKTKRSIDTTTRYTVHGVLAGAYKGKDISARVLLNHASQDEGGSAICKRVPNLCDLVECDDVAVTCPMCLERIEKRGLVRNVDE